MKENYTIVDIHELRRKIRDLITYVILESNNFPEDEQKKIFIQNYIKQLVHYKRELKHHYSKCIIQDFNIDMD